MRREHGATDMACRAFPARPLPSRPSQAGEGHDGRWLQPLVHDLPALLPDHDIERGLAPLIPACMQLAVLVDKPRAQQGRIPTPGGAQRQAVAISTIPFNFSHKAEPRR